MSDQSNLYTLPEAARLTGLSTEALRLRIRRGKLQARKGNDGLRVVLTTADIGDIVAGQERQQNSTNRTDRPNHNKALEDAVTTLLEQFGQDRSELKVEIEALRQRLERAEAEVVTERAGRTEAEKRAAVAEVEVKALRDRAELAEKRADRLEADARRPWWKKLVG